MSELETVVLDSIDHKAAGAFPGLVVRKDLLRVMRSAYSLPMFVIEFLLGRYCASTDPQVIAEGLAFVRETLRAKYVKPDERELVKTRIKQQTSFEIIDKVKVRLVETHDKYWAELANINLDYVNVDEAEIRKHERLVHGGIWAEVTLGYDDTFIFRGQNRPFVVERLKPIQVSSLSLDNYRQARASFSRQEWMALFGTDDPFTILGFPPASVAFTRFKSVQSFVV